MLENARPNHANNGLGWKQLRRAARYRCLRDVIFSIVDHVRLHVLWRYPWDVTSPEARFGC